MFIEYNTDKTESKLIEERYTNKEDYKQIEAFINEKRMKNFFKKHNKKQEDISLYVRFYSEITFRHKGKCVGETFYFKDGSSIGKSYLYSQNKIIMETPFVNGAVEGIEKWFSELGYLYTSTKYKQGKKEGKERKYTLIDNQIKIISERVFKNDNITQEICFNPLNNQKEIVKIIDFLEDKEIVSIFNNRGELQEKQVYKGGFIQS